MKTENTRNPKLQSQQPAGAIDARHGRRLWVRLAFCCNNRCMFCHDSGTRDLGIIPAAEIFEKLERGARQGFREVVLSGGEPTLNPEFLSIVRRAKEMGYEWVQTITNGRAFSYPSFCRECVDAGLDEVTFSFHECDAARHDRLTGVPGSFEQSVKGLRNMIASRRCTVSIDIVINGLNVSRLPQIMEYFIGLGAREFDLLHLIPFGSASENLHLLRYDPIEHAQTLRRAFEIAALKRVRVSTNRMPLKALEGYEHLAQPPEKLAEEIAGHSEIFDEYLGGGKKPSCAGSRCAACFLDTFCRKLFEQETMRRRGNMRAVFWDSWLAGWMSFPYRFAKDKQVLFIARGGGPPADFQKKLHAAGAASLMLAALDAGAARRAARQEDSSAMPLTRLILSEWNEAALNGGTQGWREIWFPLNHESMAAIRRRPDIARRAVLYMPFFPLDSGAAPPPDEIVSFISSIPGPPVRLYNIPPCLAPGGRALPNFKFFYLNALNSKGAIKLEKFTEIFIRYLYYEKSARCGTCGMNNRCRGLSFKNITGGIGLSALAPLPMAKTQT